MKNLRVAIIGGGPAGLSSALWLKNLGATPIVIEKEAKTGGMQNFNFLSNDWVLGQVGVTGVAVADNFYQHIVDEAIDVRLSHHLSELRSDGHGYQLQFHKQKAVHCDAIILANGTRYVGREILPKYLECYSHQVIEGPHAFEDMEACRQQHVVIVGAGDNAFENALMLLQQECQVSMVSRSTPKAQKRFMDQVIEHPRFTLFEHASLEAIGENNHTMRLTIANSVKQVIDADRLHILAGYQSNLHHVAAIVERGLGKYFQCDDNDYLSVDAKGRTNIDGIYGAGDICNTQFPCVVSAVAAGALAAKTLVEDLS